MSLFNEKRLSLRDGVEGQDYSTSLLSGAYVEAEETVLKAKQTLLSQTFAALLILTRIKNAR